MLIIKINNEIEIGVRAATKSEIPVTPPSLNPLGIKYPFNPNPAHNIPIVINSITLQ
jgi:hypothetical protein